MKPKKTYIIVLFIVLLFIVVSVNSEDDIEFDDNPEYPFVFIYQNPSHPLPGQKMISGVRFALWNDGKIVRKEMQNDDVEVWYEGKVDEKLVRNIKARIKLLADPKKAVIKRILEEIEGKDKYKIFTK